MFQGTTIPDREINHNDECVGCAEHFSSPCHPLCPFETGEFGLAVILRAAARRVRNHPAGVGYDLTAALFDAALDLVGRDRAQVLADAARLVLTDYLIAQWGMQAQEIRNQVLCRHGLFSALDEITVTLYAAAADHDGIEFGPDEY